MPIKGRKLAGATSRRLRSRSCCGGDTATEVMVMLERLKELELKVEALETQNHELRERLDQVQTESGVYLKKLETVENLVHDAEQSKASNAQTNYLGLSVLDALYAPDDGGNDEQEDLTF